MKKLKLGENIDNKNKETLKLLLKARVESLLKDISIDDDFRQLVFIWASKNG